VALSGDQGWVLPVDNSRDFLETSINYYPLAHGRNLGIHIRVVRVATYVSLIVNSDQFVTGNQWSTVILK
jgi:hypothetical protein